MPWNGRARSHQSSVAAGSSGGTRSSPIEKNRTTRTVVLGLGNMLMADDGVGLAALARLRDEWCLPPHVELVDGGTWGMNLLHVVEGADRLLIFDAISQGGTPGSLIRLERNDIPRFL